MIGAAIAVVVTAVVVALIAAVTGGIDIVGILILLFLVAVGMFVIVSVTRMAGGEVTAGPRCPQCGAILSPHQPVCMQCGASAAGPAPGAGPQWGTGQPWSPPPGQAGPQAAPEVPVAAGPQKPESHWSGGPATWPSPPAAAAEPPGGPGFPADSPAAPPGSSPPEAAPAEAPSEPAPPASRDDLGVPDAWRR